MKLRILACAIASSSFLSVTTAAAVHETGEHTHAGEAGVDTPMVIKASKALVTGPNGEGVINHVVVVVRDGKIESIGSANEVQVPDGAEVVDLGDRWILPGMIDLHNHVASGNALFVNDINDTVYLTNPGLRASSAVNPQNILLRRGCAGGVTSVLFIPGSGSNMGGQGVLLKTGMDTYDEMEIRNPGSLKLAQSGNPEGYTIGVGRSFMNWNTRDTFERGIAYAKRWEAHGQGQGPEPEKDLQLEVFRDLYNKDIAVSTHTQIYQVVLMTITMVRMELGLNVFIDHGSFDGYKTGALAAEQGVPAILGPRMIASTLGRVVDTDGKIIGMAAGYQERGHTEIGFNTDCIDDGGIRLTPPQEELPLQAGMAVRYGLDNSSMQGVRGLTIVPAKAAGIADRVGSLAPGKDADILVVAGDPIDPRTSVEIVFIEGKRVYDAEDERLW